LQKDRVFFLDKFYVKGKGKHSSLLVPSISDSEFFYMTMKPGANVTKLFYRRKLRIFVIYGRKKARVFASGKPFQPILMFVGKVGTYLIEESFRCSTLG
jgi:hypothetical protein